MSRSIHRNQSIRELKRRGGIDWDAIWAKRDIKKHVRFARQSPPRDACPPPSADGVEIVLKDNWPPLFYPATVDDIRDLMRLLPSEALRSVSRIELEAGILHVNEAGCHTGAVRDPYVGRLSFEEFPDVYIPVITGSYYPHSKLIKLFAYVKGKRATLNEKEQMELRYDMLTTLVHEFAHNHDYSRQDARGRWRIGDQGDAEMYAIGLELEWCDEYVVPLLMEKYSWSEE